ncbi:retrovirus-related Pol polyprotein from transposon 17.6 [Trichonephila clavipes]|nr:retrovirus-related Pol polyprotein from transposon 17.6 [Trichonephila clavipes]
MKKKGHPASFQAKKCVVPDDVRLAIEGNHMLKMVSNYRRYTWRCCKRQLLKRDADDATGSSDSVQEFAARINKLGTQIFQSSDSAQNMAARNANDQLLQSRFISGLRSDIRRFVLARDPNNLEQSINVALIEEQNVKLNQIANDERTGLSPLHTETSVISALTNKLEEINLRIERLQEASSITARKTGPHSVTNVRIHVSTLPNSTSSATIQSSAKLKSKNIHLTTSQINIDPQTNDTILNIRNDSDNIVTLNKNMKIITVNNYEDFYSDFPVSQDILPPHTEKDFNLSVELSAAATEHHRINLQHDYPIKCPIYKIPFNLRNEFGRQIADLEKAGIISKSNSQYNTPALFVKQKEKCRLVLDFRKLNEITLTQDFVIPTLDDILHEISGSNYFSALDMKSAFNQIPLHFADRHKTAFSTPHGDKYEFNRLCFGLKNSPKAFQSITQEVLGDLLQNGALVYIDDVILFTKTIDDHFELLVAQQSMRARNYCAHHNTRDHWTLRCMNRCPDLVVCLKRDLQCLRPEASLVLIYRRNVAGMKGRVDLAQPVNRTPDLWCGSTIHYHSILFGEK